jgi:hypothetical protein
MRLAEHQRGAHGERGLAAGEELLALDVELRIEAVFFGVVVNCVSVAKVPAASPMMRFFVPGWFVNGMAMRPSFSST